MWQLAMHCHLRPPVPSVLVFNHVTRPIMHKLNNKFQPNGAMRCCIIDDSTHFIRSFLSETKRIWRGQRPSVGVLKNCFNFRRLASSPHHAPQSRLGVENGHQISDFLTPCKCTEWAKCLSEF